MGFVVVLAGLAVGSFLNVCIDRLPAGQSLFRPRSHCDACKTPLATRDLIPVASYVMLRGRCRHCSTPIPLRVPLVEAGTAMACFGWWLRLGESWAFVAAGSATCVLIVITLIALANPFPPIRIRRTRHDS